LRFAVSEGRDLLQSSPSGYVLHKLDAATEGLGFVTERLCR